MKIDLDDHPTVYDFDDIKCSDCFEWGGIYFMRTEAILDHEQSTLNAITLLTGALSYFDGGDVVTPMKLKVVKDDS